jgi:ABC-type glycerol-3-phosphate transport system substrate-binding protein
VLRGIILGVMAVAALWLLIFGPNSEQGLPPGREHDLVIHYWEKWVGAEGRAMGQIVDDFNNSVGREKHIYVEYLAISNIDQKTIVATAGGVPPDIAGIWDGTFVQFTALDALQPMDDLAAAHGITDGYYKPVYWKACHYKGHLYALISTPASVALIYNKKIFQQNAQTLRAHGCDPDRAPRTIEEFNRYADALNTFKIGPDGKKHLDRAGFIPMEPASNWYVTELPYWFGSDPWDAAQQRFTLTDPGVIQTYDWVQSFSFKLGEGAVGEFSGAQGGFSTPQNAFMMGNVVMEMQGPWMANFIHQQNPKMDHDWAAAPFPSAVPGLEDVTYCPWDALTIPRGCRHRAEAFEFIAYVNRQDVMEKLCEMHCKNSPLARVSRQFLEHHPNPYIGVFEELANSPNAHSAMNCPIAQEAGADILAMIQGLVALQRDPQTGKIITPAQALATIQRRISANWANYQKQQRRRELAGQGD